MELKIKETAELIKQLYSTKDGGLGGYGHIVFDDENLKTPHIEFCIYQAEQDTYIHLSEETRQASLKALEAMLPLNIKERKQVVRCWRNKN